MTHYKGNHDTDTPRKPDAPTRTQDAPEHAAAKRTTNANAPKNMPEAVRREPNHPENPASGRNEPWKQGR